MVQAFRMLITALKAFQKVWYKTREVEWSWGEEDFSN